MQVERNEALADEAGRGSEVRGNVQRQEVEHPIMQKICHTLMV